MRKSLIGRGTFTLAVVVALGFGATQAFANGASASRTVSYCNKYECLDYCIEMEGVPGRCGYDQWGNFVCICG
jgi:hypothetical protein